MKQLMRISSVFVTLALAIFLSLFLVSGISWARQENESLLQGVELFTGFTQGKLHQKGNYHTIPILVAFNFDLKPLTKKIWFNPPSLVQFQLEPFIATVLHPRANVEIGNSFFFKIGALSETFKFQPYIKAGVGMVYMTQHTREQATQFNFIESGGVGMHYFFNDSTAFTLEGRIRHLSNSGIDHPNHGINTYLALAGVTYRY